MEYKFGAMPPTKDIRDYKLRPTKLKKYPKTFILKPPVIYNQGSVNSCVANAMSYLIEYFNSLQEANKAQFSRGFLYGYRPTGYYKGEGMYLRECLKTAQKLGDVTLEKFDGSDKEIPAIKEEVMDNLNELTPLAYPNRISEYFKLGSLSAIKDAIMTFGYVMVSIVWYEDATVKDGILSSSYSQAVGNHAITLYGWNPEGFLFANSWGKGWGNNGSAILPYDYKLIEAWGVSDTITSKKIVTKPNKNKFFQLLYKIFKDLPKKIKAYLKKQPK